MISVSRMKEYGVAFTLDREKTVWLEGDRVVMLDRRKLPEKVEYPSFRDYQEVARAIEQMVIQGAMLVGYAAGYGIALTAVKNRSLPKERLKLELQKAATRLRSTRPTGSDLFSVVDESLRVAYKAIDQGDDVGSAVADYVRNLIREEDSIAKRIGQNAATLLEDGDTVLTHCYAESALIYMFLEAEKRGKRVKAIATETRPYLQGARLTSLALKEAGVPVTLICDSMVAYCMWKGLIQKYVTAADRVALDGSIANKIGTYQNAIAAHEHNIPFYVLSYSGPDKNTPVYKDIVVEERDPEEIFYIRGVRIAPDGIGGYYPAFDIVPPKFISAIVTERGIFAPAAMKDYWDSRRT